jgi:hypothetical protein
MSANFTTDPTLIKNLDNCAYQINVRTTDSEGIFKVQASLDYAIDEPTNQVTNAGNWVDLTLAGGVPTISAANDSILINLNELPFNAIRLAYESDVAGTGECDIYVMAKQIGG